MKTLDEVIAEMSVIQSLYEIGHRQNYETVADALYYLKEYRSDMQMYAANQKHWEDELVQKIKDFGDAKDRYIARLKELDIGTLNDPLTWEELRKFEGKPVWIEMLVKDSDPNSSRWMLIQSDLCFGNAFFIDRSRARYQFFERDMNIIWQAYRKEPDHADEA